MNFSKKLYVVVLSYLISLSSACSDPAALHDHHDSGIESDAMHEVIKGPHGGRLLEVADVGMELKIFEAGVSPQYRIYGYYKSKEIPPAEFTPEVITTRLGGSVDKYSFSIVDNFYVSEQEVREPHSFFVSASMLYQGKKYEWSFETFEGRTEIPEQVAKISGIKTSRVSKGNLSKILKIRGKVLPNEHRIAHIVPRFSGIVREGRKHIGDQVRKNEVLAIIESNRSLQPFELKSQIAGTVINGHVIPGEYVSPNQWVYIVADVSEVWIDFQIPQSQIELVKLSDKVRVKSLDDQIVGEGIISYIAPYIDEHSQTRLCRVNYLNPEIKLLPGAYVTGEIEIQIGQPHTLVKRRSVQKFRSWDVVFVKYGSTYEARPLTLGAFDDQWVQVIEGISEGEEYVSKNSFLIKADILKSGAAHDH